MACSKNGIHKHKEYDMANGNQTFEGKVAFVTGGTSGIGRAAALMNEPVQYGPIYANIRAIKALLQP
jgi:hypothetical protein